MGLSRIRAGAAAVALTLAGATAGFAGTPKAADLGALIGREGDQQMTLTISLKLSDLAGAESMMRRVATLGDPLYHQFLTPVQVDATFGPREADVDAVSRTLRLAGLTVERTSTSTLQATGKTSTMQTLFQTELHVFSVAATEKAPAYTFHAALTKPVVPAAIASVVGGVLGFNTAPALHSRARQAPSAFDGVSVVRQPSPATATGNAPGFLTVTDFANRYDVDPLYAEGISGKGRTLAVVTLASFLQSDVFAYYKAVGLTVDPNRISVVEVDGGSGPPSDVSGSEETALDVEQSGGIAPAAKIIVYEAPNTNQAFVDVFAKAIRDNIADSMSTSFGETEIFDDLANGPVTDPFSGETVSSLQAMHELFVEAALQGQSLFAAAGDCGAFDTFNENPAGTVPTDFTIPLSVDYPGSDSAIVSSGGTTLPGVQTFTISPTETVSIDVPTERVWAFDYLIPLCDALGTPNPITCGIFPGGGGGGISVFFPITAIQAGIPGTLLSVPGQAYIQLNVNPPVANFQPVDMFNFPALFPGRNVPDVAFDADPDTGYVIFYTHSGSTTLSMDDFFGGTSFVGPQLNGVTALLGQNAGQRFGLLSASLFALAREGQANLGPEPAIKTIDAGDNWFFTARDGYSPAAGLGTIEAANLAKFLK